MGGEKPAVCQAAVQGGSRTAEIIAAFLAFSSMLLILIEVNGFSAPLALLFAFLSLFFVTAICALLESNARAYRRNKLAGGLAEFFYRVSYYKSGKRSYFRAVDKAVQRTPARDLKRIVGRASRRFRLGGSFLSGIASGEEFGDGALLKSLSLSGTDNLGQVRGALAAHELH